jgi:DNA mismatch repair protein MutL
MVGKFPGCVLHLELKLNGVDVNVHPTKQEVKFGQERAVFSAVYYAVLSALGADKSRPAAVVGQAAKPVLEGKQTSLPLHDFTAPKTSPTPTGWNLPVERAAPGPRSPQVSPTPAGQDLPVERDDPGPRSPQVPSIPTGQEVPPSPALVEEEKEEAPWRIAGELFHTYIIVEQGDKALLIDKHAAHERMNFDKMRAQDYLPMSQTLLAPVVFTPAPEEAAVLLEHGEELDISDFGGGSLAVRSVPDYVSLGDVEATLTEIAGKLAITGSTGYQERRDDILHTMACKAAIKGGWKSGPQELERVARAVMAGEVRYCPHGRPVAIELTQKQLEKQFKRS